MKQALFSHKIIVTTAIFTLVLSLLIFVSTFLTFKENSAPLKNPLSCNEFNCTANFFLNEQKILEGRLRNENPSEIYSDILLKYAHSSPNNQHSIAHIFGEVLYKSKGTSGITICDNSFAFGCFHGYFIRAIPNQGIEIVKELDRMCIEKYGEYNLGCQHGIGHGIAEYFGSQNLSQSLDTCASLSWKHQLMGCTGGVFMEYIMPTLDRNSPGAVHVKPVNIADPYAPCNSVKVNFQAECFYNLGNYYYHAENKNAKTGFRLCKNVSNPLNRKACLLGLGNSIYSNTRNINQTIEDCELAGKENKVTCRAGGAWISYTNITTRPEAKKFCENLSAPDTKQCETDSNLLKLALET